VLGGAGRVSDPFTKRNFGRPLSCSPTAGLPGSQAGWPRHGPSPHLTISQRPTSRKSMVIALPIFGDGSLSQEQQAYNGHGNLQYRLQ